MNVVVAAGVLFPGGQGLASFSLVSDATVIKPLTVCRLGGALEDDLGARIGSVTGSDNFPPSNRIDLLTLFAKYTYTNTMSVLSIWA